MTREDYHGYEAHSWYPYHLPNLKGRMLSLDISKSLYARKVLVPVSDLAARWVHNVYWSTARATAWQTCATSRSARLLPYKYVFHGPFMTYTGIGKAIKVKDWACEYNVRRFRFVWGALANHTTGFLLWFEPVASTRLSLPAKEGYSYLEWLLLFENQWLLFIVIEWWCTSRISRRTSLISKYKWSQILDGRKDETSETTSLSKYKVVRIPCKRLHGIVLITR